MFESVLDHAIFMKLLYQDNIMLLIVETTYKNDDDFITPTWHLANMTKVVLE